jgi:hypothetical protein
MGRKTKYTPELGAMVLEELSRHGSTLKAAKALGVERATVIRWVELNQDDFAAEYARAKAAGIDNLVEDTIDIADLDPPIDNNGRVDTGAVQHQKLRIETRRWYAERLMPKKYGVLQKLEHTGADGGPMQSQIVVQTGVPDPGSDLA